MIASISSPMAKGLFSSTGTTCAIDRAACSAGGAGVARPRRVDEVCDRDRKAQRAFLDAQDLLDRLGAPRARLHRRVVGHQRERPPVARADAGHHPVGAEALLLPVGEQRLLGEAVWV